MLAHDWSPAKDNGSDVFFPLESRLPATTISRGPLATMAKKARPRTLPSFGSSGPARRPGTSTTSSASSADAGSRAAGADLRPRPTMGAPLAQLHHASAGVHLDCWPGRVRLARP
eukprot:3599059-Heterocapsa_arctica.AAC.1